MAHYLAKIGISLLILSGYVLFCWGVFVSPNSLFFISATALSLALFNSAAIISLWVFYLAKQFSTHTVKVMDIKESVKTRKPVIKSSIDPEFDEEKEIKDFAESTVAKMFNRNKERLTDSLT